MTAVNTLRLRRWTCLMAMLVAWLQGDLASASGTQTEVLALYSTRCDARIATIGNNVMFSILQEGLKGGLDYYTECIDRARFPDPSYDQALGNYLRLKYESHRFGVIIAVNDLALDFVNRNRADLFPDTPVVFFSSNLESRRIAHSTGVRSGLNLSGTVSLALELQPETENLFVVSGADGGGQEYERIARAQLQAFARRLNISYLSGLPTSQLEERLKSLPPRSIVYYLVVSRDGNGEVVHPLHYVDRVVAAAAAPTYGWVNSMLERGIVGGELKDQEAELAILARLALRVLKGEHPDRVPVAEVDLTERIVSARQLQKWGISEARVPADTRNLFREAGFWERYRTYAIGTTFALIAQAVLIGGLLVQAKRRRQAESQMKKSQTELRHSYDRIRDLGGRLIDAQEAERSRVARELHDDVGQKVSLLAIDLDLLDANDVERPLGAGPRLRQVADRAHDIARSVHDLSHKLHPAKLQLMGLVPALESLRRDFSHSGVNTVFAHEDVPESLAKPITLCLFRAVQEALQNAVKHSGAGEVRIHLAVRANTVKLSVGDNGVGFDVEAVWGRGLGLVSIAERLESVGGSLHVHSTPGVGTRLDMTVPYRADSIDQTVAS